MAVTRTARHRAMRPYRGVHRRTILVVVRPANPQEAVAMLWLHTEGCKGCDQHGLCSQGRKLARNVQTLAGIEDWEHAVAA